MSERSILSFKPALRLEWQGQDGQNETEQPDSSASLGDSITSSTQIGFRYTHWYFRRQIPADVRAILKKLPKSQRPANWYRTHISISLKTADPRPANRQRWSRSWGDNTSDMRKDPSL
jgi:hypothetical protein